MTTRARATVPLVLFALVDACSDPTTRTDAAVDGPVDTAIVDAAPDVSGPMVDVRFRPVVGAEPFACTTVFHQLGTTASDWHPRDFRLYVHDVRLVTDSGAEVPLALVDDGAWQRAGVALLDFEDRTGTCTEGTPETNDRVVGHAPAGTYQGIRFRVGVPFAMNHLDLNTATAPLDITGMFWSWMSGYKFVRIEGASTGVPNGFLVHVGSVGCVADADGHVTSPCSAPNVADIELTGFDPTTNAIVVDLAALFTNLDLDTNTTGTPPGCMSSAMDPECAPLFANLGLAYGTNPPGAQRFFRAP